MDSAKDNIASNNATSEAYDANYHTPRKDKLNAPPAISQLPLPLQKIGAVEIDVLYMYTKMLFEKRNLLEFVESATVGENGQRYSAANLTVAAMVDLIASLRLWSNYQVFIHSKRMMDQQKMGMISPAAPRKTKNSAVSSRVEPVNEKVRRNLFNTASAAVSPAPYEEFKEFKEFKQPHQVQNVFQPEELKEPEAVQQLHQQVQLVQQEDETEAQLDDVLAQLLQAQAREKGGKLFLDGASDCCSWFVKDANTLLIRQCAHKANASHTGSNRVKLCGIHQKLRQPQVAPAVAPVAALAPLNTQLAQPLYPIVNASPAQLLSEKAVALGGRMYTGNNGNCVWFVAGKAKGTVRQCQKSQSSSNDFNLCSVHQCYASSLLR